MEIGLGLILLFVIIINQHRAANAARDNHAALMKLIPVWVGTLADDTDDDEG